MCTSRSFSVHFLGFRFFPHQRFSPVMLQVLNFLLCKVQLCSHSTFLTFPTNFLRYVMYKMYGTTSVSWRFKHSTIATDTENENSLSVSYLKESFVPAGNRWINFKALRHRIRIPFCFSTWHYSISVYSILYYEIYCALGIIHKINKFILTTWLKFLWDDGRCHE